MTDSKDSRRPRTKAAEKRQRLTAAAARVLHEQGVERTTIADIAHAADVPAGNVYYYFKTKGELVEAALSEHTRYLEALTGRLDQLADPRERLKGLVDAWVGQRDTAARYGCPTGTLAVELDKCAEGGLDLSVGQVIRRLLDWVEQQFRELGAADPEGLSLTFVGAYQGMSLLSSALRDPEIMTREGARLVRWLDSLT
ncbi:MULTISPECIES: TetR/AcrR family transcriptional regulator [unclassified Streptomyces]|uniref:TetR/AcrR family transcriptional regulator n=1 Tax=unclassified Streptomyces TaxID=2593676 RepID=UPI0022528780|nr:MULTISPECIES: TetR/AcrR family transcriptional regulator [unclassified Streptomyces]WSP55997.1 TetR/AcrR family transcriptional regulator [Streptomyces sp. NBC_01241]WSU23305.1 TetR/AcrR family transcriptional regulator [Streptomyces sp. NBC_01108]MCX4787724.1 TetR/AcrR family transcriptional regulator [Streptomyces sp. NBC_01221]MCX4796531.1 TetR/AcrR family transcriptional regulator [Streptomyces sp. NBC_01242]WSJ37776.1 TetR/AcrR family transcriptional regulator [Streptomyces sp. NBC_013